MEGQRAKQAGLEVLRSLADAGGDMGEMSDAVPLLTAYAERFGVPAFTCTMHAIPPTPPVEYPGVEGIERAIRDWNEAYTTLRVTLDEVVELEQAMVLLIEQVGLTRHGGVEVSQPSAMVWKLRDGRLTRLELHLDRDEALRSAGAAPD